MKDYNDIWQPLHWDEWRKTAKTVHLFTQIIGKIRLGLMPMQAEWAQVPLSLTSTGISSFAMPAEYGSFDIAFNFINHTLDFFASNGNKISFSLKDRSVSAFFREVQLALKELDVNVNINPMSVEMTTPVKMDTDEEHNTYVGNQVRRWWHLLILIGNVFNKFRSRFSGKETPVNFFWGSFDLSITFFSGKFVEAKPGLDLITRVAMDAEQATFGFWPGSDESPEPVFFAYTFPKPHGFENAAVSPGYAKWSSEKGEFILPYETVRKEKFPENIILDFCESTFIAGVNLAGWDKLTLDHKPPVKKTQG